jgi:hypothetical protein
VPRRSPGRAAETAKGASVTAIQDRRKAIHGGFGKNIPVFDNPE